MRRDLGAAVDQTTGQQSFTEYLSMFSSRVAVLSAAGLHLKTVHSEMASDMVGCGEAVAVPGRGPGRLVRAIVLACRCVPRYVGRPKALSPASYGCARYVRKVRVQVNRPDGPSFSSYYAFRHIDPGEQELTVVGRTWA